MHGAAHSDPAERFAAHHFALGHAYFVTASAVACECGESWARTGRRRRLAWTELDDWIRRERAGRALAMQRRPIVAQHLLDQGDALVRDQLDRCGIGPGDEDALFGYCLGVAMAVRNVVAQLQRVGGCDIRATLATTLGPVVDWVPTTVGGEDSAIIAGLEGIAGLTVEDLLGGPWKDLDE